MKIKSLDKRYCLDVVGNIKKNNTPIILYPCHKGPNQVFIYNKKTKTIKSQSTKKCMAFTKNKIIQKKCNKSKTQKWFYKNRQFINKKGCLDVEGGHYENGKLITYPCHNGINQKFIQVMK